jgi:hypothetical protein
MCTEVDVTVETVRSGTVRSCVGGVKALKLRKHGAGATGGATDEQACSDVIDDDGRCSALVSAIGGARCGGRAGAADVAAPRAEVVGRGGAPASARRIAEVSPSKSPIDVTCPPSPREMAVGAGAGAGAGRGSAAS